MPVVCLCACSAAGLARDDGELQQCRRGALQPDRHLRLLRLGDVEPDTGHADAARNRAGHGRHGPGRHQAQQSRQAGPAQDHAQADNSSVSVGTH